MDRENAIAWFTMLKEKFVNTVYEKYLEMAIKAIEQEPKTGRWIYSKETARSKEQWTCSCCKHDIIENPKFKIWITGESLDFIFCPMCGAKMTESEVDE